MIDRTTLQIDRLDEHHRHEHLRRYARRNRLRYIDRLLGEFELLNLAGRAEVPGALSGRVARLATEQEHPLVRRPHRDVPIAEWMDALYDLQDPLMLAVEGPDDD
jgi:hypothetical protein